MQSIFRYPGGKTRKHIREWIRGYCPPDIKEYREPFVASFPIREAQHRQIKAYAEKLPPVQRQPVRPKLAPDSFDEGVSLDTLMVGLHLALLVFAAAALPYRVRRERLRGLEASG